MNTIERTWPADAFDAISIWAPGIQLTIKSTEGEEVRLESQVGGQVLREFKLEPVERCLQVHMWDEYVSQTPFILYLPEKKNWVVDCSAARGKIEVSDIQARLQLTLQKGDIRLTNCRGIFAITCGDGHVELKHCSEADMPERPSISQTRPDFQTSTVGDSNMSSRFFRNWRYWAAEDWADWGMEFSEKARAWGQQFGQFLDHMGWTPHKTGVSMQMSKGDLRLEDIQASACLIKLSKGNAVLEQGRITELDIFLSHGNLDCKSILPAGNWIIEASHGDIHLSLPSDSQARLDVATRQGDIHSKIPLVRVARPGPEARFGGRMVGTIGEMENISSQLSLAASHGNIDIEVEQAKSQYPNNASQQQTSQKDEALSNQTPVDNPVTNEPVDASDQSIKEKDNISSEIPQPEVDPRLAILQALHDGAISIEEAEQLLIKLEA
ncbi:MAG TPA: DUF4097 family beta strand repeat-containing protein [Anaerolineaceae bacterium]|nr:DUF4097 family beta strand repeat-containing protein [Anaerolineaceae bacterium]